MKLNVKKYGCAILLQKNLNVMYDTEISPRVCEQVSSVTQKLILVPDCQEAPVGVSGNVLGDVITKTKLETGLKATISLWLRL